MAIVDLNVAKIFFLGMSIYITLIIHYHVPLHKWNYSGSIQAIGIISVLYAYFMIWHGFPIDWGMVRLLCLSICSWGLQK